MEKRKLLRKTNSEHKKLSGRFKGLAAILAEMSDTSGVHPAIYNVRALPSEGESFHVSVIYDPEYHQFTVLQTFPGKPYQNSFAVTDDGDVIRFCDHVPNTSFVEAALSKDGLPRELAAFDLKFCSENDPIRFAKDKADAAIKAMRARGTLSPNINPNNWSGRGSR